jgi:hypothetical protein
MLLDPTELNRATALNPATLLVSGLVIQDKEKKNEYVF